MDIFAQGKGDLCSTPVSELYPEILYQITYTVYLLLLSVTLVPINAFATLCQHSGRHLPRAQPRDRPRRERQDRGVRG